VRSAALHSNVVSGEPVFNVQLPKPASRKQKLPSEEIHLDFSSLPTTVIDNAIYTDRGCLRRAHCIGAQRLRELGITVALNMPDLMRNKKGVGELVACVFVKNK
jgi:hypothetical protein